MARGGPVVGNLELLDGPCGPPWDDLKFIVCHAISTVLSSWAPPGFSCPYFINFMRITVFSNIETAIGLLTCMIVSISPPDPTYRKSKEHLK
mgnify:CR=1 FL=1